MTRTRGRERPRSRYWIAAVVLLVLGVLCLVTELLSPSLIFWTGDRVVGTNDGGIVYYEVAGEQRTLTAAGDAPPSPVPVTVYADPDDSTNDRVVSPVKWFDAAFVVAPFAAATIVWLLGLRRRRGRR